MSFLVIGIGNVSSNRDPGGTRQAAIHQDRSDSMEVCDIG